MAAGPPIVSLTFDFAGRTVLVTGAAQGIGRSTAELVLASPGVPGEKLAELTAAVPLGRFADSDEIAPGVAFLCTEQSGYITGALLPLDAGMSM
jgi:3-oxoacyl-[acyl-carrier protein] reductase